MLECWMHHQVIYEAADCSLTTESHQEILKNTVKNRILFGKIPLSVQFVLSHSPIRGDDIGWLVWASCLVSPGWWCWAGYKVYQMRGHNIYITISSNTETHKLFLSPIYPDKTTSTFIHSMIFFHLIPTVWYKIIFSLLLIITVSLYKKRNPSCELYSMWPDRLTRILSEFHYCEVVSKVPRIFKLHMKYTECIQWLSPLKTKVWNSAVKFASDYLLVGWRCALQYSGDKLRLIAGNWSHL